MGWREWRQRFARGWGAAVYGSAGVRRVLWGVLFTALFTAVLSLWMVPRRLQVTVGQPAPEPIIAPDFVVNRVATERLRQQAAAAVQDVYEPDPQVLEEQVASLHEAFNRIRSLRHPDVPEEDKLRALADILPETDPVVKAILGALLKASDAEISAMEAEAQAKLRNLLSGHVYERDIPALRTGLQDEWTPRAVSDRNLQVLMKGLVSGRLRPNMRVNREATEAARQQARAAVPEVVVRKGEKIVGQGEVVTEEHYQMLLDLGLVGPNSGLRTVAGIAVFCIIGVGLMSLYLWRYRRDILERDTRILMVGTIALITLLWALLLQGYSPYLMPLAMGTMLLTILVDAQVAVVAGILLTLMTGLVVEERPAPLLVAGIGALVGAYSLRRVEQRSDLIRAGLLVAATNVLVLLSVFMVQGQQLADRAALKAVGAAGLNGVVTAMLALGTLPFLEGIFGVLTPIKLLELANPNHPLLRRLLMEAPGTYHHTILVANLSEAAAEAVGADPMLTRVGCYYHDIGKARRPYFFVENQFGGENPHDRLPPHVSAHIIAGHVKDGVEMAREHRLPEEIIDFIREHHGDMLISYFYHKATQNGGHEHVLEDDFRYDGPRPRRKETAICMLADGCEASVRALRQKGPLTQEQIEEQVQKVIRSRLEQGQLDHCDLTLRDLDIIRRTFVRVLSGAHHARIEYPPIPEKAADGGSGGAYPADAGQEVRDGDTDRQRTGEGAGDPGTGAPGADGGGPQPGAGGVPPGA